MLRHIWQTEFESQASCHVRSRHVKFWRFFSVIGGLIFLLLVTPKFAAATDQGNSNLGVLNRGITNHGITATIIPEAANPGDIVEFRVEMNRKTWARFAMDKPAHPQMRIIAQEQIPVSYQGQLYRQRYSFFLQPVSSGDVEIGATSVTVSTANGQDTILLPAQSLHVRPFDGAVLSDSPLPLPPEEVASESNAIFALLFWLGVAVLVLAVWSLVFFGMRYRKHHSVESASLGQSSWLSEVVESLSAGVVPAQDLETLLHDSDVSISGPLRENIEAAVYSTQVNPADLATRLREELGP